MVRGEGLCREGFSSQGVRSTSCESRAEPVTIATVANLGEVSELA